MEAGDARPGQGFEFWVLEKGGVAKEPVGVSFLGVDGEVAQCASFSH